MRETLEERIARLEIELAAIKEESAKELKYKVDDAVFIKGKIHKLDQDDHSGEPYGVWIERLTDWYWFAESDLEPAT